MAPDPGAAGFLAVLAACGVVAWAWMRLDDRRQARERDRLAAKVTPIDRYRGQGSNVTVTRHGRGGGGVNLLRIAHTWITQQLRLRAIDALDRSHARRYERTRHVQGRY